MVARVSLFFKKTMKLSLPAVPDLVLLVVVKIQMNQLKLFYW
jgi:hypothetical protein